jgi:hypothetical protein
MRALPEETVSHTRIYVTVPSMQYQELYTIALLLSGVPEIAVPRY